jgi:hypothetical protein
VTVRLRAIIRRSPVKYRVERTDGTPIPADEPVFVIRAQDAYALDAVAAYRRLVDGVVGADMILDLDRHAAAIMVWRQAHPDRIKVPD